MFWSKLSLLLCLFAFPDTASAQRLQWDEDWRRPGAAEWGATGILAGGTLLLSLALDSDSPHWERENAFDRGATNVFGARTLRGERAASLISDVLGGLTLAWPSIVAPTIAGIDGEGVAGPLLSLTLLSYASTLFVLTATKMLIRRKRPRSWRCRNPDGSAPDDALVEPVYCSGPTSNRSFPSGHAALTFAAAGLSCAFHQHVDLLGDPTADALACGGTLAFATTTAMLRVVGRRHHLSDVLTGALLGFAAGWLLPSLLSFGFGSSR